MYLCAVLHMNDSVSLLFRHRETISLTSWQFLRLFDVIIACTTVLWVVSRLGRCELGEDVADSFPEVVSDRLLLLPRLSKVKSGVGLSKRLLLLIRPVDEVLDSLSILERKELVEVYDDIMLVEVCS